MKNIAKYISILGCGVLALGTMTSCDDTAFLEVNQPGQVSDDFAYLSDENALKGMTGVYKLIVPYGEQGGDGDWGFKPNLFTGCHPTLDTQATSWDKDWLQQNWNPSSGELLNGWKHAYVAIYRANKLIDAMNNPNSKVSPQVTKEVIAEANAVKGFFYHWLTTTFRRVPVLDPNDNYTDTKEKAQPEDDKAMWTQVIDLFEAAAKDLDWKPYNGEYGRVTKGMALTYLGDSYMWMAYRLGGDDMTKPEVKEYIQKAKDCFDQVINSGVYELNPSFTTLWDMASVWSKEAIWVEVLDQPDFKNTWDNETSRMFTKFYCACPGNGGWGSLFLSWEWYASYEEGDKRRDGSACTGPITKIDELPGAKSDYCYGVNPYLAEKVPNDGSEDKSFFHNGTVEKAPSIWSLKLWRNASACQWGGGWGGGVHQPTNIYWKRLTNVYIDLAECEFILGNENRGWELLDKVRERAFGKLEDGHEKELSAKYTPAITQLTQLYKDVGGSYPVVTEYPIPFGSRVATVPSAKEYYTALKASGPTWFKDGTCKPYKSPAWKVAVNMERRKEFNCEWSLRPDMQRSGFMEEHIEINYPKHEFPGGDNTNSPWFKRDFEFSPERMDMPIPAREIEKNPACKQNSAYVAN